MVRSVAPALTGSVLLVAGEAGPVGKLALNLGSAPGGWAREGREGALDTRPGVWRYPASTVYTGGSGPSKSVATGQSSGYAGLEGPVSTAHIGRAGEYLAAAYLERSGIECSIVDRRGYDLWCRVPSGRMFTVQIKASNRPRSCHREDAPAYKYRLARTGPKSLAQAGTGSGAKSLAQDGSVTGAAVSDQADYYGFVALDLGRVLFEPVETLGQYRSILATYFTYPEMQRSIRSLRDLPS